MKSYGFLGSVFIAAALLSPAAGLYAQTPPLTPVPGAALSHGHPTAKISEKAALRFESLHQNFGRVQEGPSVPLIYKVTNTSAVDIRIESVRPSCGCTASEGNPDVIKAGQQAEIKLVYDTKNRPGAAYKTATVTTNDPEQTTYTLSFEGEVYTELQFRDRMVDLGEVDQNQPVTRKFVLIDTAAKPYTLAEVKADDPRIAVKHLGTKETKDASGKVTGRELEFELTVPPGAPTGNLYSNVMVRMKEDGKEVRLPVRGRVMGEIEIVPTQAVGIGGVGDSISRTLVLTARRSATMTISNHTVLPEGTAVEVVIADGDKPNKKTLTATMTFTEEQAARLTAEVVLDVKLDDGREVKASVPLLMIKRAVGMQRPAAPGQQAPAAGAKPAAPAPAPIGPRPAQPNVQPLP